MMRISSSRHRERLVFSASRFCERFFFLGFLCLFLISILGLRSVSYAQGQISSASSSTPLPDASTQASAEKAWLAYQEFLKKGEWDKSKGELEKLYQWKLNRGVRNHFPWAITLLRESQRASREGRATAIPGLLEYAEKMAPDFSQGAYARAHWQWSQSHFSFDALSTVLQEGLKGIYLSYEDLGEALGQWSNLSLWLLISFLITLVLFSFSILIRYHSFLAHHLEHLVPVERAPQILRVLSVLLLLLPFLWGWGWIWLFAFWLLGLSIYATRADRVVIFALFLFLLFLPTGIRWHSSLLASMASNGVPEIIQANTADWNTDLLRKLLDLHQKAPQDPDLLQALGIVEKRLGKFADAEKHYRQGMELEPQDPAAYNNIGNIYLATNRLEQAIEAYQKAIQLGSAHAEPYYNLGQAYHQKLLLNEAEEFFQKARELNPQLISFATSTFTRHPNRRVMDQLLESTRIWKRVFTPTATQERIAQGFWDVFGEGIPQRYGEGLVAVFLILLGLIHWVTRERLLIRNCEKCGRLICSRCSHSMVLGSQCPQCITTFSSSGSADPQLVMRKKSEVSKYQFRRRRRPQWLSLILPGMGHVLRNRPWEGLLYLFLFSLFLAKGTMWRGWVPNPLPGGISLNFPWLIMTLILFVVFYGFVQYRLGSLRWKGGRFHF